MTSAGPLGPAVIARPNEIAVLSQGASVLGGVPGAGRGSLVPGRVPGAGGASPPRLRLAQVGDGRAVDEVGDGAQ